MTDVIDENVIAEVPTVAFSDAPTPPGADDEAPWGRRQDGTPRAKPGAKPKSAPRVAAAPRPRPSSGGSKAKKDEPDYRPALIGLAHIPVMALGLVARFARKPEQQQALALDGMAVKVHAPNLADALNETAKVHAPFASALEKIITAGPLGIIFAASMPLVMQCLANHKVVEPNPAMGTMTAEQLVEAASRG